MPFAAYDSDALRLLSVALADALDAVGKSAARPLTERETSEQVKRFADDLMRAYDLGERDPSALKSAALQGRPSRIKTAVPEMTRRV